MADKRRVIFTTGLSGQSVPYLLRDDFTDTVAAGSVNGTTATPTGQTRVVADAESKISVGSGVLSISGGKATPAYGDPSINYGAWAKTKGQVIVFNFTCAAANKVFGVAWDDNGAGASSLGLSFLFWSDGTIRWQSNAAGFPVIGSYSATTYHVAIVQRTTGGFGMIKGGAYTNWTFLWSDNTTTLANYYPYHFSYNESVTSDFIRVPVETVSFAPLASDSFNRANGAIGTADGAGTEETAPTATWTNKQGAATIATNKAVLSTLDGTSGWGIVTLPAGLNVLASVNGTRTGDDFGLVVRYADADNYVKVLHNGTNLQMIKVVAGTPTTLVNAAATYSAGADITCIVDGTSFSAYYNNALIGTTQTVSDAALQTSTSVGLYSTNTANTFDNFRVWDRKSNYGTLDRFIR